MRDADNLNTKDGVKYLVSVPKGETIISMVAVGDSLFIATEKHLYQLVDEKRLEVINLEG